MMMSSCVVVGRGVVVVVVVDGLLLKVKELGVGATGGVKAKVGGVGVIVAVGGLAVVVDGGGNEEVAHGVVVGKVKGWAVVAPPNGVVDVTGLVVVVVVPPNGVEDGKVSVVVPPNGVEDVNLLVVVSPNGLDEVKGFAVVVAPPNGVGVDDGVPKVLLVALLAPKGVVGFWPKKEGVVEFCAVPKTVLLLRENRSCDIVGLPSTVVLRARFTT